MPNVTGSACTALPQGRIERPRAPATSVATPGPYQTQDTQRSARRCANLRPPSSIRNVRGDHIESQRSVPPSPEFFEMGRWFVTRELQTLPANAVARQTLSKVEDIEKIDHDRKAQIADYSTMMILQRLERGMSEPGVRAALLWMRFSPAEAAVLISDHYTALGLNQVASTAISEKQAQAEQMIQDIIGWYDHGYPEQAIREHLRLNTLPEAQIDIVIANYHTSLVWRGEIGNPSVDKKSIDCRQGHTQPSA